MPPLRNVEPIGCHSRSGGPSSKCLARRRCTDLASWFVDIRVLDDAAAVDDAVFRDFYDINRRAELLGREEAPFWSFPEFLAAVRGTDAGERQELFAAYDGDRMVATA